MSKQVARDSASPVHGPIIIVPAPDGNGIRVMLAPDRKARLRNRCHRVLWRLVLRRYTRHDDLLLDGQSGIALSNGRFIVKLELEAFPTQPTAQEVLNGLLNAVLADAPEHIKNLFDNLGHPTD